MYTKRNQRRQFLKIASGLLATPLGSIGSFANAQTISSSPLRFLTIIDHFGVPTATRRDTWISSQTGDYALENNHLGSILQPLRAYRENMLVVSNMNLDSLTRTRTPGTHHGFVAHTLGASEPVNERSAAARIPHESVDVTIGNYLHEKSNGRIYPHTFFTDYASRGDPTYCYDTSGVLIRSIDGAANGVSTLFGSAVPTTVANPAADTFSLAQQSVLQSVSARVQALKSSFGNASSQEKLEAYEDSVNSLAEQLESQASAAGRECTMPNGFNNLSGARKNSPESDRGDILKVIGQLFSCDMVSSATYAFGGELHNQHSHSFIDGRGDRAVDSLLGKNMHAASHQEDNTSNRTHEYIRIHQSELIAELLEQLSTTIDIDGSPMIDNTVLYLTSSMAHNTHQSNDYALAIIAGKNTNLIGGYHYDIGGRSNNDLLVTLAQGVNVPITDHGGYEDNGSRVNALNTGPIEKMLKTTLG